MTFPELEAIRIEIAEDTRRSHLDAIQQAIRSSRTPRIRRLRLLVVATALVLLLPVLALAAERSVPGDFLYPLKRLVEPVVGVVDRDVAARQRVYELETLVDRGASMELIDEHVHVARQAVADHHPELHRRIDRIAEEVAQREDQDGVHTNERADVPGREVSPQDDQPTTTTTVARTTSTSEPPVTDSTRPRDGRDG